MRKRVAHDLGYHLLGCFIGLFPTALRRKRSEVVEGEQPVRNAVRHVKE
jgi:hypothetical protein